MRGLVFLRVLVTATPLSARVDSDVVEEEDLNCAKRSGRVRLPNRNFVVSRFGPTSEFRVNFLPTTLRTVEAAQAQQSSQRTSAFLSCQGRSHSQSQSCSERGPKQQNTRNRISNCAKARDILSRKCRPKTDSASGPSLDCVSWLRDSRGQRRIGHSPTASHRQARTVTLLAHACASATAVLLPY